MFPCMDNVLGMNGWPASSNGDYTVKSAYNPFSRESHDFCISHQLAAFLEVPLEAKKISSTSGCWFTFYQILVVNLIPYNTFYPLCGMDGETFLSVVELQGGQIDLVEILLEPKSGWFHF